MSAELRHLKWRLDNFSNRLTETEKAVVALYAYKFTIGKIAKITHIEAMRVKRILEDAETKLYR